MNKRQRKKKTKKFLDKLYIGFDLANGQDYTAFPIRIAEQIYKAFGIPEHILNNSARENHLQYRTFMNMIN